MAIFYSYVQLPEGKSHKIPLNHHFPIVFLWPLFQFANCEPSFPKAKNHPAAPGAAFADDRSSQVLGRSGMSSITPLLWEMEKPKKMTIRYPLGLIFTALPPLWMKRMLPKLNGISGKIVKKWMFLAGKTRKIIYLQRFSWEKHL